jgi:hypothetical protein
MAMNEPVEPLEMEEPIVKMNPAEPIPPPKRWNPGLDELDSSLPGTLGAPIHEAPPISRPAASDEPPADFNPFAPPSSRFHESDKAREAAPDGDSDLPELPASPLDPVANPQPAVAKFTDIPLNPVLRGPQAGGAATTGATDDVVVPLPGTITERPNAMSPEKLDLEGKDVKPKNLLQVACVFPAGCEKLGQQFVMRLKDFGNRVRKAVTVQAVFVQAWKQESLDLIAWSKSAMLSGADVLYVIAPRKDRELFQKMDTPAKDGVPMRLLYLEQTELRTLYADLLVEAQRRR